MSCQKHKSRKKYLLYRVIFVFRVSIIIRRCTFLFCNVSLHIKKWWSDYNNYNNYHFIAWFGAAALGAVISCWTVVDVHGFIFLLCALQSVGYSLNRPHPFLSTQTTRFMDLHRRSLRMFRRFNPTLTSRRYCPRGRFSRSPSSTEGSE